MSYISEDAKTAFAWRVGILGAVCLFLQLAFPLIFIFTAIMIPMGAGIEMDQFDHAFFLNGSTYIVTNHMEAAPFQGREKQEFLISRLEGDALVRVAGMDELPERYPHVQSSAVYDGKAWLFFSEGYITFDGEDISGWTSAEKLGENPEAAVFRERLVVLSSYNDRCHLMRYTDGEWEEVKPFDTDDQDFTKLRCCRYGLEAYRDRLFYFRSYKDKFYMREYLDGSFSEWVEVSEELMENKVAHDSEGMFMIGVKHDEKSPFSSSLIISRFDGKEWTRPVERPGMKLSFNLSPVTDDNGAARLFGQSFGLSGLKIMRYDLDGYKLLNPTKIGGQGFPFFGKMMLIPYLGAYLVPIITTLIMAIGVTIFMGRYRTGSHPTPAGPVPYASVMRRAIAQIADLFIVNIPFFALAGILYMAGFERIVTVMEEHPVFIPLGILAFLGFFFIWGILYFTVPEGLWGLTPGKMLVRIRVLGEDMKPCGLGRALLRNILKIVDGFFNFLVGIIVVAFTENWQRVGDLVARTIVVYEGPKSAR